MVSIVDGPDYDGQWWEMTKVLLHRIATCQCLVSFQRPSLPLLRNVQHVHLTSSTAWRMSTAGRDKTVTGDFKMYKKEDTTR